jgi:hypothetical protein
MAWGGRKYVWEKNVCMPQRCDETVHGRKVCGADECTYEKRVGGRIEDLVRRRIPEFPRAFIPEGDDYPMTAAVCQILGYDGYTYFM